MIESSYSEPLSFIATVTIPSLYSSEVIKRNPCGVRSSSDVQRSPAGWSCVCCIDQERGGPVNLCPHAAQQWIELEIVGLLGAAAFAPGALHSRRLNRLSKTTSV